MSLVASAQAASGNSQSLLQIAQSYSEPVIAVCSILGLITIGIAAFQLWDNRQWNRLQFTYTFFPNSIEFDELETYLDSTIKFYVRADALTDIEAKALLGREQLTVQECLQIKQQFNKESLSDKIIANRMRKAGRKLKLYLNQIEVYCAAANAGVIDIEAARHLYAYKFKRAWTKSASYVSQIRSLSGDQSIYVELERVISAWYPNEMQKKTILEIFERLRASILMGERWLPPLVFKRQVF
jgi:hypothetical protein